MSVGLAGFAFQGSLTAEVPAPAANVKVTGLEISEVKVNRRGNWAIVRLQANAGVKEIGDALQSGQHRETFQFLTEFSEVLKGRSIFYVAWFRARVAPVVEDHGGLASVAASALEQCLRDIRGKVLSLPAYELLGGTLRTSIRNYASINRLTDSGTAGGESFIGVRSFCPYIKAEAVDILMPDVQVCGGMWELKKNAALGEGTGQLVSRDGPASPAGNVAAAHVCATLPNFHILEFSYGEVPWRAELLEPAEVIVNGGLELSRCPGLGIPLNDKTAAKYAV